MAGNGAAAAAVGNGAVVGIGAAAAVGIGAAAAAAAAAVGIGAAAAAPRPPRADLVSKQEQEMLLELSGRQHAARMSRQERPVPDRTARKKLEVMIHRYKKSQRTKVFQEDLWKQVLIEIDYNDSCDKRAQILFLKEEQDKGKKVQRQLDSLFREYEDKMARIGRKRTKIAELGFTPPALPKCFDSPPHLLPRKSKK